MNKLILILVVVSLSFSSCSKDAYETEKEKTNVLSGEYLSKMIKETLPETNVLSGEYLSKMVKETLPETMVKETLQTKESLGLK